jgi:hypothetical protein
MSQKQSKIFFMNIPEKLQASFKKAVISGLNKAEKEFGTKKAMQVLYYYDSEDFQGGMFKNDLADGSVSHDKKTIIVRYNVKLFQLEKDKNYWLKSLESTIIHEYVHTMGNRPVKTVMDKIVSEGISCYVQTKLSQVPKYLDIDKTSINDVRKWWGWWQKKYFDKLLKDVPIFENEQKYREPLYRIGYHIIKEYLNEYPNKSMLEITAIPVREIKRFAENFFTK